MSRTHYDSISNLQKGKYGCNIKVRVLRKWPIGNADSEDKALGFNLLLLDNKDYRVHAFIANEIGHAFQNVFTEGQIYTISNFTMREYVEKDTNLPIESGQQIMFSSQTKVHAVTEDDLSISNNAFEFYNIGDLEKMATQDKYLTDIIGVAEEVQPIRRFVSQKGRRQIQLKFILTDGRSKVNTVLWGKFAESFQKSLTEEQEQPLIVIISSGKVSFFGGVLQVSTYFNQSSVYLNYEHHTVTAMRKKLREPVFASYQLSTQTVLHDRMLTVADILELPAEYIGKKVIAKLRVKKVKTNSKWLIYECTSCQQEVKPKKDMYECIACNRELRYADMKFTVAAICNDETGALGVVFKDRDIQRLTKTTAYKLHKEHKSETFPPTLKTIQNVPITVWLQISEDNAKNGSSVFNCSEVDIGHEIISTESSNDIQQTMSTTDHQNLHENATTSSYETVHLTELNILTPPTVNKPEAKSRRRFPSFKLLSQDSD